MFQIKYYKPKLIVDSCIAQKNFKLIMFLNSQWFISNLLFILFFWKMFLTLLLKISYKNFNKRFDVRDLAMNCNKYELTKVLTKHS